MRLGLLGQVRKRWVEVGYKLVQPVQVEYKWSYLLLAVDGTNGKLYWTWVANMKAMSIVEGLTTLKAQGVGAVVWDGARSHTAAATLAVDMIKIKQPPYSPELNPAERVFEEVRRAVEGRVYENVAAKQAAVDELLAAMNSEPARIQQLAGWEWIAANRQAAQQYAA
jgi:transposase